MKLFNIIINMIKLPTFMMIQEKKNTPWRNKQTSQVPLIKHLSSFLSVLSMTETLSEKELPVNLFINQNQMGHLTEVKSFVVFVRWNLKSIEAQ